MGKLAVIAQNTMDLYYQQFKSTEDFFELSHFEYLNSIAYAAVLQEEYEKSYKMSLIERGIGMGEVNTLWLLQEEIEIKKSDSKIARYEAEFKQIPFSFKYDRSDSGVQEIIPLNGQCDSFIKMSVAERWKLKLLPYSNEIFWYPMSNKIYFSNIHCGMSKALLLYVPGINSECADEAVIADTMEESVIRRTLELMFQARNGAIIDMSSDQNPNKNLQTEINEKFSKTRA